MNQSMGWKRVLHICAILDPTSSTTCCIPGRVPNENIGITSLVQYFPRECVEEEEEEYHQILHGDVGVLVPVNLLCL